MSDSFYKYFGIEKQPTRFLKNQEVSNLFRRPPKETKLDMPKYYNFLENDTHQADILFLPNDNGYAYALVVVDVATSKADAFPLKDRRPSQVKGGTATEWHGPTEEDTIDAIAIMYGYKKSKRKQVLEAPNQLITDSGNEFGTKFQMFMDSKKINFKKALPGRHRQIAMVERKNQVLGRVLFMRMFSQEMLTGDDSVEWVEDLPLIIEKMNEKYAHKPATDESLFKKSNPWQDLKQKIIPLGTKVRVILDEPRDWKERKLSGKFRSTDQRWTQDIYKITDYIFDPHEPIMYKTDRPIKRNERVAYTANQLQIVPTDEQDPSLIVLRGKYKDRDPFDANTEFVIKEIIGRRKQGKVNQVLVWWKGYKKDEPGGSTWESESKIKKRKNGVEKIRRFDIQY